MSIELPKIPSVEEIKSMSDASYEILCKNIFSTCYECIGAIATISGDFFEARSKNYELNSYCEKLINEYNDLISRAHAILNYLSKVRYSIK